MLDEIALVVSNPDTQDSIGAFHRVRQPVTRTVLCRTSGVRRSEWAAAGAAGHKPEMVVTVAAADYQGEQSAQYGGVTYSIYRTYPVGDWETELYLEARAGGRYGG